MEISITLQTSDIDFDIDFRLQLYFTRVVQKVLAHTQGSKLKQIQFHVRNNIAMLLKILSRLKNPLWVRSPHPPHEFWRKYHSAPSPMNRWQIFFCCFFMRIWDTKSKFFAPPARCLKKTLNLPQSRAKIEYFFKNIAVSCQKCLI